MKKKGKHNRISTYNTEANTKSSGEFNQASRINRIT